MRSQLTKTRWYDEMFPRRGRHTCDIHALDATRCGHWKILIRTIDTDIVVLAVSKMKDIGVDELWTAFGTGKHFRYMAAHDIAAQLGHRRRRLFQCFTLLLAVIQWYSPFSLVKGKLLHGMSGLSSQQLPMYRFGYSSRDFWLCHGINWEFLLYSRTSTTTSVNKARQELFSKNASTLESIPTTQAVLLQHIKRAVFQAGYIWGNALVHQPHFPSPCEWGWEKVNDEWKPVWTLLPQAQETCYELIHYGCKKECERQCKCSKANFVCTALCKCGGQCDQDSWNKECLRKNCATTCIDYFLEHVLTVLVECLEVCNTCSLVSVYYT